MIKMTYREQVIETTKLVCQDIIDRIEELIPDTEGGILTEINIRIPTMTDTVDSIPTCEVHTEVYPKMLTVEKIIDILR